MIHHILNLNFLFVTCHIILYGLYNTMGHLVHRQWSADHSLIGTDLGGCELGMPLE